MLVILSYYVSGVITIPNTLLTMLTFSNKYSFYHALVKLILR